jgi:hypothetical protein
MSDSVDNMARLLRGSREELDELEHVARDANNFLIRFARSTMGGEATQRNLMQFVAHTFSFTYAKVATEYIRLTEPNELLADEDRAKVFIRTLGDLVTRMAIDRVDDLIEEMRTKKTP